MNGLDETLVVIPARGGSKRIPKKNIVDVAGQPMIYWPITELLKVFVKQQVIVSTDDEEISLDSRKPRCTGPISTASRAIR